MGIGVLSKRTGCKIETIRFYEKQGLLPEPPRSEGGHRVYNKEHLKRLTFVRRCRDLGFSMAEVKGFLSLVDGHTYTCHEVRDLTMRHIDDIRSKIADLSRLKKVLLDISANCSDASVPDCPIVDALYRPLDESSV